MKLVVVESPAKAKTINKYLGSNYKVLASEVVEFETEWRVYVLKGDILGVRPMKVDTWETPHLPRPFFKE